MYSSEKVEIRIVYFGDSTLPNERILLVGSIKELGNWNVSQGIHLLTEATSFPQWTATIFIPTEMTFEYKYVIVEKNSFEVKRWEKLDNNGNRIMTVKQKGTFSVFEKEGLLETIIKQIPLTKSSAMKFRNRSLIFDNAKNTKIKIDFDKKQHSNTYYHKTDSVHEELKLEPRLEAKPPSIAVGFDNLSEDDGDHSPGKKKKQNSVNMLSRDQKYGPKKLILSADSISSDDEQNDEKTDLIRNIKDLENRVLSFQDVTRVGFLNQLETPKHNKEAYLQPSNNFIHDGFEDIRENYDEEHEVEITNDEVVVMVTIKLPFNITKNEKGEFDLHKTNSLLYSKLYDSNQDKSIGEWWIGWSSIFPEDEEEKQTIIKLFREKNGIPIFFEENIIDEYYNFYEKQVVPLFHNFKTHFEHKESYDQFDDWDGYKKVNEIFSDEIKKFVEKEVTPQNKSCLVWVNNQHLILTPRYLRTKVEDISIGLFLHCPFPASELFKLIPYRKSLLNSLLNCDGLGFHSFEYARNFFTTGKRVLGVNFEYQKTGQLGIDYHGRNVSLVISHVGVSYESIYKQIKTPKMKKLLKTGKESKRKIFASVDTLSQIAGLKEKLLGYQQFLRSDPSHAKTCKLIQYLEPISYGKKYHTSEYKEVIMKIKDEIVKEFGNQVISIKIEPLTENKRLMLWARTDFLLNTTLRGGLRLPSLEYIAVRCILGLEGKSLIILSEFAGGIRALGGVLKCNPYSIKNTATTMERGYNISSRERCRRMRSMLKYVVRHSTQSWANQFLRDIKIAHNQLESSLFLGLVPEKLRSLRLMNKNIIKPLNKKQLLDSYNESTNRLIVIDVKGIVATKDQGDYGSYNLITNELSDTMVNLLDKLSRNEENKLWLISPEKKQQISSQLRSIEKCGNLNAMNTAMSSKFANLWG